jgi:hypothetical protein
MRLNTNTCNGTIFHSSEFSGSHGGVYVNFFRVGATALTMEAASTSETSVNLLKQPRRTHFSVTSTPNDSVGIKLWVKLLQI